MNRIDLKRRDPAQSPLHAAAPHESGLRHTSGEALYVDDMAPIHEQRFGFVVTAPVARGRITRLEVEQARALPGVDCVLTAADIPGINDIAPAMHDEPLLAVDEVFAIGQSVAFIVADSLATCRKAAALVDLQIEALPALVDVREAIAAGSFIGKPHVIARDDVDAALAAAPLRLSGEVETGGQDHFYLETQAAICVPEEHGTYKVYSSTQHPSEVQAKIAEILALGRHQVVVETARMGGGFGGKETQAAHFAAMAALGARATGKPVRVWLNRDQDMLQTGKRHPFLSRYEAGFDEAGRILALKVDIYANGGWSMDLSHAILDRSLFHLDSSFHIPALRFTGRVVRTNVASNTAFRGFGGPQGMIVTELVLNRAAARLGLDPAEVRRRNFYADAPRDLTPYGQAVRECRLERIDRELMASADYAARRSAIDAFNAQSSPWVKRGIGYQTVKFGISFTNSMLNQAGALVHLYADGSVQLNHGGTEMGQGLHTKMLAVCAHELGVPLERIRMMHTATDKVPNTSATAASSGTDLNGAAVRDACRKLTARLRPVAAGLMGLDPDNPAHATLVGQIAFADGRVYVPGSELETRFEQVVSRAWMDQVSLSATGYYKTPDIAYDHATGRGKPFHYFAYGGCVCEVEVNGLTGEHRLLRADILHDVGDSLVPSIDRGQVEGGFVQGWGWLSCEELVFDARGMLRTHSPDTYKIPAVGQAPLDFRVALLERAPQPGVIHGSKAVGEPPFMLAIAGVTALQHAIAAFAQPGREVELAIPCTPEAVLRAIETVRAPHAAASVQGGTSEAEPVGA